MEVKNLLLAMLLSISVLMSDDSFVEVNYGYYDGQANSLANTADDKTLFPSFSIGSKIDNIRVSFSSDQIRWSDAKAYDIVFGVDYMIPSDNLEYYIGAGLGVMKFKADFISDNASKEIATLKTGINYLISKNYYLNTGIKYIYTNELSISDSSLYYANLDDFIGIELGIGFRF